MRNPLEVIARCFVTPIDEFRAAHEEEKIVPPELTPFSALRGKREKYVRKIHGTLTGKIQAYEQDGGNWIVDDKVATEEYEISRDLHAPLSENRFIPNYTGSQGS